MKTKPLIKQPTYEEIEAKIRFAGSWMHTICAVANDTAHTLSLDAIDELKAAGLYRRGIKHTSQLIVKVYSDYEAFNYRDIGAAPDIKQTYLDYLDERQQSLEHFLTVCRGSLYNLLGRCHTCDPHPELQKAVAAGILAKDVASIAVKCFDQSITRLHELNGYGGFRERYWPFRLTNIPALWSDILGQFPKMNDICISEDDDYYIATVNLTRYMCSAGEAERGADRALNLNPEMRKEYDRREHREAVKRAKKGTTT